jgi:hypothetical protein
MTAERVEITTEDEWKKMKAKYIKQKRNRCKCKSQKRKEKKKEREGWKACINIITEEETSRSNSRDCGLIGSERLWCAGSFSFSIRHLSRHWGS